MTKHQDLQDAVRALPKSPVWFYRPAWYWFGWGTLLPVLFGHDDYARRTMVLGWTITGRMVVALNYCGRAECYEDALEWAGFMENEALSVAKKGSPGG